jgi:hypothetical protein
MLGWQVVAISVDHSYVWNGIVHPVRFSKTDGHLRTSQGRTMIPENPGISITWIGLRRHL